MGKSSKEKSSKTGKKRKSKEEKPTEDALSNIFGSAATYRRKETSPAEKIPTPVAEPPAATENVAAKVKKPKKRKQPDSPAVEGDKRPTKKARKEEVAEVPDATDKPPKKSRRERAREFESSKIDASERTCFVGNVPVAFAKVKLLKKLFTPFGAVESIRFRNVSTKSVSVQHGRRKNIKRAAFIQGALDDTRECCNAYVVMANVEAAKSAAKGVNNCVFHDKHLRVGMANNDEIVATHSVFVGNLSFDLEEEALRAFFAPNISGGNASILDVRITRDSYTHKGRGFGFVSFSDASHIYEALACHGEEIEGRPVRVTKCEKKEKRSAPVKAATAPEESFEGSRASLLLQQKQIRKDRKKDEAKWKKPKTALKKKRKEKEKKRRVEKEKK